MYNKLLILSVFSLFILGQTSVAKADFCTFEKVDTKFGEATCMVCPVFQTIDCMIFQ